MCTSGVKWACNWKQEINCSTPAACLFLPNFLNPDSFYAIRPGNLTSFVHPGCEGEPMEVWKWRLLQRIPFASSFNSQQLFGQTLDSGCGVLGFGANFLCRIGVPGSKIPMQTSFIFHIPVLALLLPFFANTAPEPGNPFMSERNILHPPFPAYQSVRNEMATRRKMFQAKLDSARTEMQKDALIQEAGQYLSKTITEKLIPHWYGTPWSFSGYSEAPQKGSIACGYFVSTVLVHAGFNLNRFKLAQQRPGLEVQTLHQKPDHLEFPFQSPEHLSDSICKNLKDGLYIFGQQFHVGFMVLKNRQVSLIHSSYLGQKPAVTREPITRSKIVPFGSYIFFGEISTNKKLVLQWIKGHSVAVRTD
jgi:hypothetical protein